MTFNDTQDAIQQATQQTNNGLRETGVISDDTREKLKKLNTEFKGTAETIKNDFSKSLTDAIKGGDSFSSAFLKVRKSLEDLAIKTAITNPIANTLFGSSAATLDTVQGAGQILPSQDKGGLLGQLINGIADTFGARAFGGPVGAGKPYLVGERGPELFVPQTAGSINPNVGQSALNITMNISATDAASFQASQTQIAASMMDAARKAQRIR
jgi:hypothetical protein